jgi:hypothetical protein
VTEVDYDASLEVERIREAAAPATPAEAALASAVAAARAAAGPDGTPSLWALGCELRARHGYLVKLRRSLGPRQSKPYLRGLRHAFLVVRGVDGDEGALAPGGGTSKRRPRWQHASRAVGAAMAP